MFCFCAVVFSHKTMCVCVAERKGVSCPAIRNNPKPFLFCVFFFFSKYAIKTNKKKKPPKKVLKFFPSFIEYRSLCDSVPVCKNWLGNVTRILNRLKKQSVTVKLPQPVEQEPCETSGTKPETGFGSSQRVPWMLSSAARSWEGQRPVFVASLPRVLLPAPSTPLRYTPSLASPPRVPPFSPPFDSDRVSFW